MISWSIFSLPTWFKQLFTLCLHEIREILFIIFESAGKLLYKRIYRVILNDGPNLINSYLLKYTLKINNVYTIEKRKLQGFFLTCIWMAFLISTKIGWRYLGKRAVGISLENRSPGIYHCVVCQRQL